LKTQQTLKKPHPLIPDLEEEEVEELNEMIAG
jgi:hypothetical protein